MSEIKKVVAQALEKQFNNELFASNLYLQMALWFEVQDWEGSAHWMYCQAKEERDHAIEIAKHLADREWNVKVSNIDLPPSKWKTPLDVWKSALAHEVVVTNSFNDIMKTAKSANDHQSQHLCYKFLDEQIEEEDTLNKIIRRVNVMGDNLGFYVDYDAKLGERK